MGWDQYHSVEPVESLVGRLYLEGKKNFEIAAREIVPTDPNSYDATFDWNYPASLEHITIHFAPKDKGFGKLIKYIPQIYKEECTDDEGTTYWRYFPEGEKVTVENISLLETEGCQDCIDPECKGNCDNIIVDPFQAVTAPQNNDSEDDGN